MIFKYVLAISILILQITTICSNTKLPLIAIISAPANYTIDNVAQVAFSQVEATYVRWLEASGADSVVIHPWYTNDKIAEILSKVNGVLLQDWNTNGSLNEVEYFATANYTIRKIIDLDNSGEPKIPIFAIGHGMVVLHKIISGTNTTITENYNLNNQTSSLLFDQNRIKTSRLYSMLDDRDLKNLSQEKVLSNFNRNALNTKIYAQNTILRDFFRITALAEDINGKVYVASVEAFEYPIYAVQYHPQETVFGRDTTRNINNSENAIRISKALGNFFVQETKQTNEQIDNVQEYDYVEPYSNFPTHTEENKYVYYYQRP